MTQVSACKDWGFHGVSAIRSSGGNSQNKIEDKPAILLLTNVAVPKILLTLASEENSPDIKPLAPKTSNLNPSQTYTQPLYSNPFQGTKTQNLYAIPSKDPRNPLLTPTSVGSP